MTNELIPDSIHKSPHPQGTRIEYGYHDAREAQRHWRAARATGLMTGNAPSPIQYDRGRDLLVFTVVQKQVQELDLTEAEEAFKAAWHKADAEGREGERVRAGIIAALPKIRFQLARELRQKADEITNGPRGVAQKIYVAEGLYEAAQIVEGG